MELPGISVDVGAKYDPTGFERFDRALGRARQDSKRDVNAHLGAKYDRTGVSRYERDLSGLSRSMATTRDEQGRLRGEQDKYESEARRAAGTTRRGSAGLMGMAGSARMLAGTAGIGAVVLALRQMVSEQSDAQAVGAQTEAVLKSTGGVANVTADQLAQLSNQLSLKASVDDEAIQSGGNLLLTFTKVRNEAGRGNDVFTQALGLSADLSRAWGKDLNGSAILVGKALNDPVKGVSALSRVGIQFTKDQKEQIKTLVESGKTFDAQKLILKELRTQVGGSAEAYGKTLPGALDRAKVSFNNLAESLGGKLAPAASAAADVITGLLDTAQGGKAKGKTSGFVNDLQKGLGTLSRSQAARGVVDLFQSIWSAVRRFGGEIGKAFGSLFGGRNAGSIRRDLGGISRFVGNFVRGVGIIFGGLLRVITPIFTGMIRVVRGALRIIAGIVTLDFGKVFSGLQDVVAGALGGVIGAMGRALGVIGRLLRAVFRPIAGVFRSAWNTATGVVRGGITSIVSLVSQAPGRLLGLAGRFASAGVSLGRSFINAIGNGLNSVGNFLGNIGRGIANWINDNTPFGDKVSIGPVSVTLPRLARGGKVGPGSGGARLFLAGEGGKDEWVISQEGDRRQNIAWAMEALTTLTGGSSVPAFKSGGKPYKGNNPITGKTESHTSSQWAAIRRKAARLVSAGTRYRGGAMDTVEEADLALSRYDGATDSQISAAIRGWRGERWSGLLAALRSRLSVLWSNYSGGSSYLTRLQRQARSGSWGERVRANAKLREVMADVTSRRNNAANAYTALRDALDPESTAGASTAEQVALAAAQQVAKFNSSRADTFAQFGRNFVSVGDTLSPAAVAAGMRYFGAGSTGQVAGRGVSGATVSIVNNFQSPPPDAHLWSRSQAYELKALI